VRRTFCTTVLGAVLPLVACTYPPQEGRVDRVLPGEYPQVAVLEGLDDRVFVHDVTENPGPPMSVTVYVRNNRSDGQDEIQYRFMFYDRDHRLIGGDPDWNFKFLPARTKVALSANAMDRGATEWNLEIRPAH
jgi:hypothetical protein